MKKLLILGLALALAAALFITRPTKADFEKYVRETTTIGLRHSEVARECLDREIVTVETALGAVRFKVARRNGHILNAVPEFEDCANLAAAKNLSVKEVQALAVSAYRASRS